MDSLHDNEHGHYCYVCGVRVFKSHEILEDLCEGCMVKLAERLADLNFDMSLPQEH